MGRTQQAATAAEQAPAAEQVPTSAPQTDEDGKPRNHAGENPRNDGGEKPRSMYVVLLALMIAILLSMLDNMIVGTAMPTIVGELGGAEHLSWVVTAYTLATAASTPIWGKLGDMYGRKGMFLSSIVIFLAGSALSGMAQNMGQLIGFRAVQGLGAGGLMVGVMAIIGDLVPPRERGRYQGLMAAVMAVAMIGGPLAGGAITDHLGWRWSFYINLPLGAVAFFAVSTVLHLPKKRAEGRIDFLGAGLLTVGITAIVLVTTWGGSEYAWTSVVIMELIALGAAALVGFFFVQTRTAQPIIPLRIFRNRNFALMSVIGFVTGFVIFGSVLFLPLFQQAVQGASATNSGLLLLPLLSGMLVVSLIAGRVTTKTGKYRVFPIAGGLLLITGTLLLSRMDTGTSRLTASLSMAVLGAGLGALSQISMLVAQNSVEMKDMGVASSTATLTRTLGSSFGVALMGVLFNNRVEDVMTDRAGALGGRVTEHSAQLDADSLAALPAAAREAYQHAVASGTQAAFLLAAAASVLVVLASLFVQDVPLRGAVPASGEAAGPADGEPGGPTGGEPGRGTDASTAGAAQDKTTGEAAGSGKPGSAAPAEPIAAGSPTA